MNIHRSAPIALAFGAIAVLLPAADKSWMRAPQNEFRNLADPGPPVPPGGGGH